MTDSAERGAAARAALAEIARNFAFSWHPEVRALFDRLDGELFQRVDRNPFEFVDQLSPETLARVADDEALAATLERLRADVAAERDAPTRVGVEEGLQVAYFSLEFGIDDSLRVYSGGLGILAGDHLKSASELGLPLVGVGLLYRHGYFRQGLAQDGWQVERYPDADPNRLSLTPVCDDAGAPLLVHVQLAGEPVAAQIWRADIGRVPLYLLDADIDENDSQGRLVTSALYGGDRELRIRQEVLLGVGGVRALELVGAKPTVFHMNEGHAAFLALERLRRLVEAGTPLEDALAKVRASTVFTTHTPVPAGNEVFETALVERYLAPIVGACGLAWDDFLAWGRVGDADVAFGLTPLALRTSARANGVSALHAAVSRRMWSPIYPERELDDVPIGHVTNGVHARTWMAADVQALLAEAGVRPAEAPAEQRWDAAYAVDDGALWRVHERQKRALGELVAARAGRFLDPNVLTLGFARRFATYKRAGLLFSQVDRLARLLSDSDRSVQILIAGKAHPADDAGKELIRRVVTAARALRADGRIVFVEDYDMELARHLVAGVDVWLNTPRRPLEASGTSGMKAGMNGVLNCSVLDGWWPEAYAQELGWAIGGGFESVDEAEQDAHDAESLFSLLEDEIVPLFYERDGGLPTRWLAMMKASIARVGAQFNTHRMVSDYLERFYVPAHREAAAVLETERAA